MDGAHETPVMPKARYEIMANYMPKVGSHGLDMMLRTCTVQVNLDFATEADMVREVARRRWRCSRSPPRSSPTRRSPRASRTASSRCARRSGGTPTPTAPACCRSPSRTAWASSATSTGRSTCRCTSSCGTGAITTWRRARSATSSTAMLPDAARRAADDVGLGEPPLDALPRGAAEDATWRCAAPMAGRGGGCARCRRFGSGSSTIRVARCGLGSRRTGPPRSGRRSGTRCRAPGSPRRSATAPCSTSPRRWWRCRARASGDARSPAMAP